MRRFAGFFEQKNSEVRKQRKVIKEVLAAGPTTVSQLSAKIDLAPELVVWNLMGMLKWGEVEVSGEQDHELVYTKKEV
jgi:hypothetical protein